MGRTLEKCLLGIYMILAIMTLALVCAFACTSAAHADSLHESSVSKNDSSLELNIAKQSGLVEKKSGLYFYQKGKKLKNSWKKVKGKTYYFGKDGKAYHGAHRIDGKCYLFNPSGILYKSKKTKLVERGKYTYYVTKTGQVLTDWQLIGTKLYHFTKLGRMDVGKTVDNVVLNKKGVAQNSVASRAKKIALKTLNKTSKATSSRSVRLRAGWNYLTSRRHFRYASIYPNLSKKHWQYTTAYQMMNIHRGNCYSFACAFAVMAEVLGYDSSVVLGRVHGSRDGAADGFTRHAWVKIGAGYYDPEMRFASNYHIYNSPSFPMSTKNVRIRKL